MKQLARLQEVDTTIKLIDYYSTDRSSSSSSRETKAETRENKQLLGWEWILSLKWLYKHGNKHLQLPKLVKSRIGENR